MSKVDWSARVGTFSARASCWACDADLVRSQYSSAICPNGCCTVDLCLTTYGHKVCVREKGHEPPCISASGTSWMSTVTPLPKHADILASVDLLNLILDELHGVPSGPERIEKLVWFAKQNLGNVDVAGEVLLQSILRRYDKGPSNDH